MDWTDRNRIRRIARDGSSSVMIAGFLIGMSGEPGIGARSVVRDRLRQAPGLAAWDKGVVRTR